MSVGAAWYGDTPRYGVSPAVLETYSSWGQTTLYLDARGNRLAAPLLNQKPDFVAPGAAAQAVWQAMAACAGARRCFTGLCWPWPPLPADHADGTQTSFFGSSSAGNWYFYGTSAAAPHAGALAALMLQRNPGCSPATVYQV